MAHDSLITDEVVEKAANRIWPLENLSSDKARDELRRDVREALVAAEEDIFSSRIIFEPDDALVMEIDAIAKQLGFTQCEAFSYVCGLGLGTGRRMGLFGERATKPASIQDMIIGLSELASKTKTTD